MWDGGAAGKKKSNISHRPPGLQDWPDSNNQTHVDGTLQENKGNLSQ